MALYRKYRPASFAEVVGQDHVTVPLSRALDSGRINHAYLFSGPRGCGKTSSARILARSLNCEQGPTSTPCGECNSCIGLAPGGAGTMDVTELDAASHNGVDDMRDLRESAYYAPSESRYRVFIIDEAHMISSAGFNALLKIVEEPPEHLIFIFATTEPEKLLATIRSRTHNYPFRLLAPPDMRGLLERVVAGESVPVEDTVYPLVVRAGGGSPRDSLSIMDQLLAGAGPDGVTYSRALSLLGVTDRALIDRAVAALAGQDQSALFEVVDDVIEAGYDPRRFAEDLLDRFRDLLVLQAVPDALTRGLVNAPAEEQDSLAAQAQSMGQAQLTHCAALVNEGLGQMRGATAPRLLLEILCARMALPAAGLTVEALAQRIEALERGAVVAGGAGTQGDSSAPKRRLVVGPARRQQEAQQHQAVPTTANDATPAAPQMASAGSAVLEGNGSVGNAAGGNTASGNTQAGQRAEDSAPGTSTTGDAEQDKRLQQARAAREIMDRRRRATANAAVEEAPARAASSPSPEQPVGHGSDEPSAPAARAKAASNQTPPNEEPEPHAQAANSAGGWKQAWPSALDALKERNEQAWLITRTATPQIETNGGPVAGDSGRLLLRHPVRGLADYAQRPEITAALQETLPVALGLNGVEISVVFEGDDAGKNRPADTPAPETAASQEPEEPQEVANVADRVDTAEQVAVESRVVEQTVPEQGVAESHDEWAPQTSSRASALARIQAMERARSQSTVGRSNVAGLNTVGAHTTGQGVNGRLNHQTGPDQPNAQAGSESPLAKIINRAKENDRRNAERAYDGVPLPDAPTDVDPWESGAPDPFAAGESAPPQEPASAPGAPAQQPAVSVEETEEQARDREQREMLDDLRHGKTGQREDRNPLEIAGEMIKEYLGGEQLR